MVTLNPYLSFNGNTEEAFNFYKSVFGGEFVMIQRYRGVDENMPAEHQDKIMHISLPIGKGNILMGMDDMGQMGGTFIAGSNFHLSVSTESEEETDRIFAGLSAGGQASMPPQKTFWGAYFSMLTDKFGTKWMVSYDYPAK